MTEVLTSSSCRGESGKKIPGGNTNLLVIEKSRKGIKEKVVSGVDYPLQRSCGKSVGVGGGS